MSSQYGSIFSFAKNLAQQQAAEPDDNYGMGPGWQAINSAPIDPNKPAFRPSPASVDPYGSGPLPDNFGNQTQRLISTGYPNTVAPIGLMPLYGGPQLNAVTHSVATQVVKEAIAAIPSTPATIVFNGVNEQTGNYTAQASDSGKLISFDITSPATLTLPATSPGNTGSRLSKITAARCWPSTPMDSIGLSTQQHRSWAGTRCCALQRRHQLFYSARIK